MISYIRIFQALPWILVIHYMFYKDILESILHKLNDLKGKGMEALSFSLESIDKEI